MDRIFTSESRLETISRLPVPFARGAGRFCFPYVINRRRSWDEAELASSICSCIAWRTAPAPTIVARLFIRARDPGAPPATLARCEATAAPPPLAPPDVLRAELREARRSPDQALVMGAIVPGFASGSGQCRGESGKASVPARAFEDDDDAVATAIRQGV
jgi:hypothetical protein